MGNRGKKTNVDAFVEEFGLLSIQKGRGNPYGAPPPQQGACACVSNQAVRKRLGVQGDPGVHIDHIYEKHRAEAKGRYADIEANKELAPAHLNTRWGNLYKQGKLQQLEQEKREYYGDARYEEAVHAVRHCNKKYNYAKK